MSPVEVNLLTKLLSDAIVEINFSATIVSESNMVNQLRDRRKDDDILLFGVLPNYDADGSDVEQDTYTSSLRFFCLNKTDYGSEVNDKTISLWQAAYEATLQLKNKLIELKTNNTCSIYDKLDINSINISVVWAYAECNGYMLSINLEKLAI